MSKQSEQLKHWREGTNPFDEPTPGIREQADKVERIYHENSWAKLRAIIVGDVENMHIMGIASKNNDAITAHWPKELRDVYLKHGGENFKDAWPEKYEEIKSDSEAYVKALEKEGVTVVTNKSHVVPEDLKNYLKGHSEDSIWGQFRPATGSLYGNILLSNTAHHGNLAHGMIYYEFFQEMMKKDDELIWLSGPPPYPAAEGSEYIVEPIINFLGNGVHLPGKIIIMGIGVNKPEDVYNLKAPRNSAHAEFGVEVGRRMLAPFGYKVIPLYYNAHLTYDFESMWLRMEDGKLGLPENALWPTEHTKGKYNLPKEIADDWEVFITPTDEFMTCCNNTIPLGNKRHLMNAHGPKTMDVMVKAGQEPIPVPFRGLTSACMSGMHCHSFPIHREND